MPAVSGTVKVGGQGMGCGLQQCSQGEGSRLHRQPSQGLDFGVALCTGSEVVGEKLLTKIT